MGVTKGEGRAAHKEAAALSHVASIKKTGR